MFCDDNSGDREQRITHSRNKKIKMISNPVKKECTSMKLNNLIYKFAPLCFFFSPHVEQPFCFTVDTADALV